MTPNRAGLALALLILWFCAACAPPTPEPGPIPIFTSAAETVSVDSIDPTLSAGGTAVAQLTGIAGTPRLTLVPVIITSTPAPPTDTQSPSPTVPPTPTVPLPCNQAEVAQDVTVRQNSAFIARAAFIKTWRLRNTGSCTWTANYALVFYSGERMSGVSSFPLPASVAPGESVDVSIPLTAPASPGSYRGEWLIRDGSNILFGTGPDANEPLSIQIRVFAAPLGPASAYDFAANYCAAAWSSATGPLSCPGPSTFPPDPQGSVVLLTQPGMETGLLSGLALATYIGPDGGGWIRGQFPPYLVQDGDRFRTQIGCASGSPGCNVTFWVDYQTGNGVIRSLGVWREVFDGSVTSIDIDISSWAGQTVSFTFGVTEAGASTDSETVWLRPRIDNPAYSMDLILTWNQQTEQPNECNELRIYLEPDSSVWAHAWSCAGNGRELGRASLTEADRRQVLTWMADLSAFEGEVYPSIGSSGGSAYFHFNGRGRGTAADFQIQGIHDLAQRLFRSLTQ